MFYPGEPFDLAKYSGAHNFFAFRARLAQKDPDILRPDRNEVLLDEFIAYLTTKFGKPPFFDVKYNQTHHLNGESYLPQMPPWIMTNAFKKNVPIVHLTRRNLLRNFVSIARAKHSGIWHAKDEKAKSSDGVNLDMKALWNFIEFGTKTTNMFENWLHNRPKVFTIDYSELFQESGFLSDKAADGIEKISGLIRLSETKTDFVKLTPNSLEKAVSNFDEVAEKLKGTEYEWMLYD